MNRRKKASNLGFPSLLLLGIAVVIVSAGGIGYVVMKNRQLTVRSQIAEVHKKMDKHQVTITLHQSDIEETLGIFNLEKSLKTMQSRLRTVTNPEPYQEANPQHETRTSVARK